MGEEETSEGRWVCWWRRCLTLPWHIGFHLGIMNGMPSVSVTFAYWQGMIWYDPYPDDPLGDEEMFDE